jgi:hypothetical protein
MKIITALELIHNCSMKIITALELINNCSMKIITTLELINTSGLHYYGGICNALPVMEINLYNVFTSQ